MFATPPCLEQRRLAIVVAAEITPCISGSFSVKERSCALVFCGGQEVSSDVLSSEPRMRDAHVCGRLSGDSSS